MNDNWILINGEYINKNYITRIEPVHTDSTAGFSCFDIGLADGSYIYISNEDKSHIEGLHSLIVREVTGDLIYD